MAAGALGSVPNRLRHENGDTHVVICDDVFSDAGSTPAASTTSLFYNVQWRPKAPVKWGVKGLTSRFIGTDEQACELGSSIENCQLGLSACLSS